MTLKLGWQAAKQGQVPRTRVWGLCVCCQPKRDSGAGLSIAQQTSLFLLVTCSLVRSSLFWCSLGQRLGKAWGVMQVTDYFQLLLWISRWGSSGPVSASCALLLAPKALGQAVARRVNFTSDFSAGKWVSPPLTFSLSSRLQESQRVAAQQPVSLDKSSIGQTRSLQDSFHVY